MVIEQLAVWGPEAERPRVSLAEAEAYCRKLAQSHYENFPVVTWALPRRLHQHFYNVYAFCRWADDLGDEVGDRARSLQLLGWWRDELAACYAGDPRHPVFVALAPTIARYGIPQQPFADLISAFEQDQTVTEYETYAELLDYCRRSADPVGRIVLHLCERFTEQHAAWSDAICTGLQLANFWQDVARDYDIGRVYLPREDRVRFGYSDSELASRTASAAFLQLMEFEVGRARELLLAGQPLIAAVPGRLQVDIDLFVSGGLAILEEVEKIGFRVWERRPELTKGRVGRMFLRAAVRALLRTARVLR